MSETAGKPGFFRSLLNSMIEGRRLQAERYVNSALLAFDDQTLKQHCYSRAELERRGRSGRS